MYEVLVPEALSSVSETKPCPFRAHMKRKKGFLGQSGLHHGGVYGIFHWRIFGQFVPFFFFLAGDPMGFTAKLSCQLERSGLSALTESHYC